MEPTDNPVDHPADIHIGNYDTWKSSAKEVGVVIVGGGVSGLTAAKTLLENNVTDILVLEAQDRLGGRVKTQREDEVLVEEGAEWIHGGKRNHLYRLAKQLQEVMRTRPDSDWDERVRTSDGCPSDASKYEVVEDLMDQADVNGILRPYYHTGYGQFYIDKFPDKYGEGWNSSLGQAWLHLLEKTVNAEEGTNNWFDISARDADEYVAKGEDHQWKDGYDTLITHLKESIPEDILRVASPVCRIFWDVADDDEGHGDLVVADNGSTDDEERGVLVVADNGRTSFFARYVIITVSVGHLKERHHQLFQPSLPEALIKNLNSVSLGVADKIQIGWKEPWWGTQDPLSLFILWTKKDLPREMEWLYGVVDVFSVHKHTTVLQTFVTGDDALRMEELPKEAVKEHLMHLMEMSTGCKVPQPTFFNRSLWGHNPWTRGSYSSYVTMAGEKNGFHKRNVLATPLINTKGNTVLLWAGEHVHDSRYGTVDGAMETGKKVAAKLLKLVSGKGCKVSNNNIPDSFS